MKCPACDNELTEKTVTDIELDVCEGGCGGIWFDNFELKKFDEQHEHAGAELLDVKVDESLTMDHEKRRNCPRCESVVLMRHFYSVNREVEVDECPRCGGYWLDNGELKHIRSQYATEELRSEAADAYFDEMFGGELEKLRSESEEKAEKASRIAHIFRFLLPSYYIPGKQKWGAY